MSAYLLKRDGGMYYFRRAIPFKVRPAFGGKREWIKSLGTKDRRDAKRRLPSLIIAFDEAIGKYDDSVCPHGSICLQAPQGTSTGSLDQGKVQVSRSTKPGPVPLLTTFEAYAREQGIKAGTAAEWRSMLRHLITFVGHDDAALLTTLDIDRWRDALLCEAGRNGKVRKPGTVKDKYLCSLRATLAWAVEKRILTANVALNVRVRAPKGVKLRERDFTNDEATRILAASKSDFRNCSSYEQRARRWIPWLCAYTGARVNEISQLRGSDVKQVDGIWIIEIRPDAGTVKNNEVRQVPLHRHLLEQGFLTVSAAAGKLPIFFDQNRVRKAGPNNRYFKKVGERLRDWVRNEVGITDPAIQPNHGWRHTFKTRTIDADIPGRVADAIQGHAPRSVGQGYGAVSLAAKARAIDALPRFSL